MKLNKKQTIGLTVGLIGVVGVAAVAFGAANQPDASLIQDVYLSQEITEPAYMMAGKVEAVEKADVALKMSGRVLEMPVDIGSTVKKGDVLLKLDVKEMQAQLMQAQAGIKTAEASYAKIKAGARTELRTQAKGFVDSASKAYDNAKINYNNAQSLFKAGYTSKQDLLNQEALLKNAEAQYTSAKSQYEVLQNGETGETLEVASAQVAQAKAGYEVIKAQLDNSVLLSPVSGRVSAKNINVGELGVSGMNVLTIVNSDSVYITAYLPARLAEDVKAGQNVDIRVSEVEGQLYHGTISVVDPVIDSKNKNVLVKVQIKDVDEKVRVGMFAEIALSK